MEVCYAYDSIWRVIVEMSAADWAGWVSGLGSLAAIGVAIWLYARARDDADQEAAGRRRVLAAMLRPRLRQAVDAVPDIAARVEGYATGAYDRSNAEILRRRSTVPSIDRLIDLQAELQKFGGTGEEAIARFIEHCMQYNEELAASYRRAEHTWTQENNRAEVNVFGTAHRYAAQMADSTPAAREALDRLDAK